MKRGRCFLVGGSRCFLLGGAVALTGAAIPPIARFLPSSRKSRSPSGFKPFPVSTLSIGMTVLVGKRSAVINKVSDSPVRWAYKVAGLTSPVVFTGRAQKNLSTTFVCAATSWAAPKLWTNSGG